jgi:hypothetical protein
MTKTKCIGSATGMLAMAAFTGLLAGAAQCASASTTAGGVSSAAQVVAGHQAQRMDSTAHACKGQNACKGQGGCGSSDNGCSGKNSCKGKGGCNTTPPASQPSAVVNFGQTPTGL